MATPHIAAEPGDFAKTVLMPGDPLRSKFIAENYLTDPKLVNNVRGVQGYTGTYKGVPVSVMASGMGIPSIGIYSYELYNVYGVENIIRVGSAGAISYKLKVRDIVLGQGACTTTSYGEQFGVRGTFAPIADFGLLRCAAEIADDMKLPYTVGNLVSADAFYDDDKTITEKWMKLGALAIEMEAAGLYMNAARAGKKALAICTVSDHILTGDNTTSEERRSTFRQMMELALEVAVRNA